LAKLRVNPSHLQQKLSLEDLGLIAAQALN
jgi:hypothetical protein